MMHYCPQCGSRCCEWCGSRLLMGRRRFCSVKCLNESQTKTLRDHVFSRIPILGKTECWPWTGQVKSPAGYGVLHLMQSQKHRKRRTVFGHRAIYELLNGPIAPGVEVLHTCDNPPCCNPAHLRLGTHRDNMLDMIQKGRNPVIGRRLETEVRAV
jgi:hypothetical protein